MGKNSRSNSCLHCSQLLPFLKYSPKYLNTAPVSGGRIRITNVLSSVKPKPCISSNLLTKRKIASGSSEVRDGIYRNNSTITRTILLQPPTCEPKLLSGGPLRVACKDTSLCTLAWAVSVCCLHSMVAPVKCRTSLGRNSRTSPSLLKPSSEQSCRSSSTFNL